MQISTTRILLAGAAIAVLVSLGITLTSESDNDLATNERVAGAERSLEVGLETSRGADERTTADSKRTEAGAGKIVDQQPRAAAVSRPVNDDSTSIDANEEDLAVQSDSLVQDLGERDIAAEAPNNINQNPFSSLLKKVSISCEFDAGTNTGARSPSGLTLSSAAFQGGPIVYHSLDAELGTAVMTGSLAGMPPSGQAEVRLVAGAARLHFFASLPNGGLVLTTVFSDLNEQADYIAIMSSQGGRAKYAYASQFLGSCH